MRGAGCFDVDDGRGARVAQCAQVTRARDESQNNTREARGVPDESHRNTCETRHVPDESRHNTYVTQFVPDESRRIQTEQILAAQAGDAEAMNALVERHIKLVHAAAKRFPGSDSAEITQSGCVGLIEAIRRFDVTRGVMFSTYAVPYILGEMRHFLRVDHSVHIPRRLQDTGRDAARVSGRLCVTLGREPTIQEIASEMGASAEDLVLALESRTATISLDAPVSEIDDTPMHQALGDATSTIAYDRVIVRDMLERCDPEEKRLISLRFYEGLTQAEVARVMGISQPQASRLEKRLLLRLRERGA